jgi:hypothetical protein
MEEYERISDQLRKYIDADTGKYKPDAEKLLLKRKRIIHKAENKKIAISDLLEERGKSRNWIILSFLCRKGMSLIIQLMTLIILIRMMYIL